MRKTKIICTLGPAVGTPDKIAALIDAGMNVARFNFSHGDHGSHGDTYAMVDTVRKQKSSPLATLLDTRGPEVRTRLFEGGSAALTAGQPVRLTGRDVPGNAGCIPITHETLWRDVSPGMAILLDDGLIELRVDAVENEEIRCTVMNGGVIKDRKGVNIPGADLSLPYLSEKDIADIAFGAKLGFDYLAASFVNSAEDIRAVRALLAEAGRADMGIIAKIESERGVKNIDEILAVSEGVMVARGDLGVEIPVAEVPVAQKLLIKRALAAGKIVIVATQMLESMTHQPRPTRAEAADVANAIYDGATAIMLSGETAAGDYPVETVAMMSRIAERIEGDIDYPRRMSWARHDFPKGAPTAIARATCTTADDMNAAAIVTVTVSGHTARMISSYHPKVAVLGCTPNLDTYRRMALLWGVRPILATQTEDSLDSLLGTALDAILAEGLAKRGDLVVITAGVPIGIPGTTNMLKAQVIGEPIITKA